MSRPARRPVLVIAEWLDPTADAVVQQLAELDVPVVRVDVGDFPTRVTLSAVLDGGWSGSLATEDRDVELGSVRAVYCRRPTGFRFPDGMGDAERRWAAAEARIGIGGVLAAMRCLWVNHPWREADAAYKPWQLWVAAESGLRVPATLVTNDPERARAFASAVGPVVYKPLAGMTVPDGDGRGRAAYTSPSQLRRSTRRWCTPLICFSNR